METINDDSAPMDLSSLALDGSNSKVATESQVSYANSSVLTSTVKRAVDSFLDVRKSVIQSVTDSLASAVDRQKEIADRQGRKTKIKYIKGDKVLLSTEELPPEAVSNFGSKKLNPKYIGPFTITEVISDRSYKLDIPSKMRLHPTFYVGRLKPYLEEQKEQSLSSSRDLPNYELSRSGSEFDQTGSQFEPETCSSPVYDEQDSRNRSANDVEERTRNHRAHSSSRKKHQLASRDTRSKPLDRDISPSVHRPPPLLVDSHGNERYVVERLLKKQRRKGKVGFLVKWVGYPSPTWEPQDVLIQDVPDLVKQFSQEN